MISSCTQTVVLWKKKIDISIFEVGVINVKKTQGNNSSGSVMHALSLTMWQIVTQFFFFSNRNWGLLQIFRFWMFPHTLQQL